MKRRATSAMISLSGHLPQGGDVEEINYEKREKTLNYILVGCGRNSG